MSVKNEVTDKIWFKDVNILFQKDRINEIYPTKDMTTSEKLNALLRLSVLGGFFLAAIFSNYMFLHIPLWMAFFQVALIHFEPKLIQSNNAKIININNESQRNQKIKETFQNVEQLSSNVNNSPICVKPTKHNPFMNALQYDSRYRQPACLSHNDKTIEEQIEDNFDDNLFKDVSDIYNRRHSERQFFTMPYTTFPNDQGGFAKWLYGEPRTCKEGNGAQCVANNYEKPQSNSYKFV